MCVLDTVINIYMFSVVLNDLFVNLLFRFCIIFVYISTSDDTGCEFPFRGSSQNYHNLVTDLFLDIFTVLVK